ncbi:MAG: hypothetical protein RL757_23 [Bacteroidota bacterium]|jgi:hypothetical protein
MTVKKKHDGASGNAQKVEKSLIVHEKRTNSLIEESQFLMFKKRKLLKQ